MGLASEESGSVLEPQRLSNLSQGDKAMADFKLTGGCFCGGVRYTVTAPAVDTHHCHCSICRKFHGAIFVTLSVFPRDAFTYDKGTGNLGTYNSSEKVHRHFCTTCGCPISLDLVDNHGVIAVPTGTIDR